MIKQKQSILFYNETDSKIYFDVKYLVFYTQRDNALIPRLEISLFSFVLKGKSCSVLVEIAVMKKTQ